MHDLPRRRIHKTFTIKRNIMRNIKSNLPVAEWSLEEDVLLLPVALLVLLLLLLLVNESNCFWKKSCARASKPVGRDPDVPSLDSKADEVDDDDDDDDDVDDGGSDLGCVTICFTPTLSLLLFRPICFILNNKVNYNANKSK